MKIKKDVTFKSKEIKKTDNGLEMVMVEIDGQGYEKENTEVIVELGDNNDS